MCAPKRQCHTVSHLDWPAPRLLSRVWMQFFFSTLSHICNDLKKFLACADYAKPSSRLCAEDKHRRTNSTTQTTMRRLYQTMRGPPVWTPMRRSLDKNKTNEYRNCEPRIPQFFPRKYPRTAWNTMQGLTDIHKALATINQTREFHGTKRTFTASCSTDHLNHL